MHFDKFPGHVSHLPFHLEETSTQTDPLGPGAGRAGVKRYRKSQGAQTTLLSES